MVAEPAEGSKQSASFDESWAAAVSIPMTMGTGLFVNLLSQEWNAPWPVSVSALVVLGAAQFALLRSGRQLAPGLRLHRVSEHYLVAVAFTALLGYCANWVVAGEPSWDHDYDIPVFGSTNTAAVIFVIMLLPWLMARGGRPAWMWAMALFAGFCGAQLAARASYGFTSYGFSDRLGWWLFAIVVIWLTTHFRQIFRSLREVTRRSPES